MYADDCILPTRANVSRRAIQDTALGPRKEIVAYSAALDSSTVSSQQSGPVSVVLVVAAAVAAAAAKLVVPFLGDEPILSR